MWARIDSRRGVWKAPAGLEATVRGTIGPNLLIGNDLQDNLNELGINCLRSIIGPTVIWGARTLATKTKPEFRYVSVRRTQNMIGESLYNALQSVVFEPNDHKLWASLRGSVTDFMSGLHRAGAFQGEKASDAYYVRCNLNSTMTQGDIDAGIVRVVVGFAPLKPAEFVVVQIKQIVGQAPPDGPGRTNGGLSHASTDVSRQRPSLRPLPDVQVPGGDRRTDRRRPVQDGRAQAHHGSRSNGATPATRRQQRNMPGGSSFEAVALEQGLSHDPIFEEWANAVNNVADGDAGMSLEELPARRGDQRPQPPGHAGPHLSPPPCLGLGVPGAAGVRRQQHEHGRHPVDHHPARGLRPRSRRRRAGRDLRTGAAAMRSAETHPVAFPEAIFRPLAGATELAIADAASAAGRGRNGSQR